eukprot:CAMPEP_0113934000 /NCGR_PEP_ID=MMETSP1339-20121228/1348_1 /TAXON_ID=94617 /ORGANISM="Fibrocapsa japonica" /LENGTH=266 /DNA_ID=CAMNT_0000935601 /DNA_START=27 /DNA_END=827 /DNA_ORIENTATION=+ /assembly_acc=CAM_ASM_000762
MAETESLSHEEISQLNDRKAELKAAHLKYVETHPEIKTMLNDLVCACLLEKPGNIFAFAEKHFASKSSFTKPLVIAGPSGVGKGTIIKRVMEHMPDKFGFCVSHTTRGPRPGEENGVHYHFTDRETMQTQIDNGQFVEFAEVHGNLYGTSVEAVNDVRKTGKICVLDIDVQGVQKVKESDLDPMYIFVSPPSLETLEQRLRDRKTETEEQIERRLGNAKREMEYGKGEGNFNAVLINDDLDTAVDECKVLLLEWYPTIAGGLEEQS